MLRAVLISLVALASTASHAGAAPPSAAIAGEAQFRRCAACHLATGRGVPGAYPPLGQQVGAFARDRAGRTYLVGVVSRGVTGPLSVAGAKYNGFMPAQAGLSDADLSETLNYLLTTVARAPGSKPFTPAEVRDIRAKLGPVSAQQTLGLRPPASSAP